MKSRDSAGKALLCVLSRQFGQLLCCLWGMEQPGKNLCGSKQLLSSALRIRWMQHEN